MMGGAPNPFMIPVAGLKLKQGVSKLTNGAQTPGSTQHSPTERLPAPNPPTSSQGSEAIEFLLGISAKRKEKLRGRSTSHHLTPDTHDAFIHASALRFHTD